MCIYVCVSLSLNFLPSPRNASFSASTFLSSPFLPVDSDAFLHGIRIMYITGEEAAISETLVAGSGEARVLISLRKVVAWIIKTRWKHASFFRLICIRSGQGDVGKDLGTPSPSPCVSAFVQVDSKVSGFVIVSSKCKSVRKIVLQWFWIFVTIIFLKILEICLWIEFETFLKISKFGIGISYGDYRTGSPRGF